MHLALWELKFGSVNYLTCGSMKIEIKRFAFHVILDSSPVVANMMATRGLYDR
jgi:hypothetical protein